MKRNLLAIFLLGILISSCEKGGDDTQTPDDTTNPPTNNPTPPATNTVSITSITPTHGAGGTNITIVGSGFSTTAASNLVKINGKTATVVSAKTDSIVVTIPIKAGSGDITLTSGDKTVTGPALKYDTVYVVSTVAGSTMGFADGNLSNAQFYRPHGMCTDAAGNVYIADRGNCRIRKISTTGDVSTIVGTTSGFTDGPAATAQLKSPFAVARDAQGTFYITDYSAHAIRKYTDAGGLVTISGGTMGYAAGTLATSLFNYPTGVCVNSSNKVYFLDASNVLVRSVNGNNIDNIAGNPCQSGGTDGWNTGARFDNPFGLCSDGANLYVADTYGQKIRKVTPTGDVTTIAGSYIQGKKDGVGTEATFLFPSAVCVDASGNLYVADTDNQNIRKITPAGVVTTIAGTGNKGSADGIGTAASFNQPYGICIDAQGNIYVADTFNNRIRKIVQQ